MDEIPGSATAYWAAELAKPDGGISRDDVLAGLLIEHRELLALFAGYAQTKLMPLRRALLNLICKKTRLHYLVETGVFFALLVDVPGTGRLLDQAGEGYATAIPLLNELTEPDNDPQLNDSLLAELRAVVERHIDSTEGAEGAFVFSRHANIDWDGLARKLIRRRMRLAGEAWQTS